MQKLYQIIFIPTYKPHRGNYIVYTDSNYFFNLFKEDDWLPDVDLSSIMPNEDEDPYDAMERYAEEPNYPIQLLNTKFVFTE